MAWFGSMMVCGGIWGRAGVEVGARTRPDWGITHCGPPSHFHLLTPPAYCFSIDNLIYFSNSFRTRGGATCKARCRLNPPLHFAATRPRASSLGRSQDSTNRARSRPGVTPLCFTSWHTDANHIRTITLRIHLM